MEVHTLVFQIINNIFMGINFITFVRLRWHFDNIATHCTNNLILIIRQPFDSANILLCKCISITQQMPPQGLLHSKPFRVWRIDQPLQHEPIPSEWKQILGCFVTGFGLQITGAPVQVCDYVLVQVDIVDWFVNDRFTFQVNYLDNALGGAYCHYVEILRVQGNCWRLIVYFDFRWFNRGSNNVFVNNEVFLIL